MKKKLLAALLLAATSQFLGAQGFFPSATQWNIPAVTDNDDHHVAGVYHTVIDMNGDGLVDLVDTENEATNNAYDVFYNGQQKYWKVYLNNGSGFNATAVQWNIPAVSDDDEHHFADTYHTVADMNGDGKPDFVDTENQATNNVYDVFYNGQQKYWKVYLNNGAGFNATAVQWNLPAVSDSDEHHFADTYHTVADMNGDGKPDFVDTENESTNNTYDVFYNGQQKYWKVYLNNGSGFNTTAVQWNIPAVSDDDEHHFADTYHTVADMNGDGKPDFIDTENQATNNAYDVFYNGQQKYWKVYLNNGLGFSATAVQWNIPAVSDDDEHHFADTYHTVVDMNGDGKPDFIDTENQATNSAYDVFYNGQQKYWKVYLNNGAGFNAASLQWNIPAVSDSDEHHFADTYHSVIDMNGDGKPDFIDSENEATNNAYDVFYNGQQKYWKVYLNNAAPLAVIGFDADAFAVSVYPNPTAGLLYINTGKTISQVAVYNAVGQRVYIKSEDATQDEIDLSDLPRGIYWVKITAASAVKTVKILKR